MKDKSHVFPVFERLRRCESWSPFFHLNGLEPPQRREGAEIFVNFRSVERLALAGFQLGGNRGGRDASQSREADFVKDRNVCRLQETVAQIARCGAKPGPSRDFSRQNGHKI